MLLLYPQTLEMLDNTLAKIVQIKRNREISSKPETDHSHYFTSVTVLSYRPLEQKWIMFSYGIILRKRMIQVWYSPQWNHDNSQEWKRSFQTVELLNDLICFSLKSLADWIYLRKWSGSHTINHRPWPTNGNKKRTQSLGPFQKPMWPQCWNQRTNGNANLRSLSKSYFQDIFLQVNLIFLKKKLKVTQGPPFSPFSSR